MKTFLLTLVALILTASPHAAQATTLVITSGGVGCVGVANDTFYDFGGPAFTAR